MIPWLETIPSFYLKNPLTRNGLLSINKGNVWTQEFEQWIYNLCNEFFRTVKLKKLLTLCVDSESFIGYWTNHNKVRDKQENFKTLLCLLLWQYYNRFRLAFSLIVGHWVLRFYKILNPSKRPVTIWYYAIISQNLTKIDTHAKCTEQEKN